MKPIGLWKVGTIFIVLCIIGFFAGFCILLMDRQASQFSVYLAGILSGVSLVSLIQWWRAMKLP